jgi:hypothetical protein
MKKSLNLLGLLLVAAIALAVSSSSVRASLTGYLYGHGLFIQSVPGTTVASISNAGALSVTSVVNTGALSATTINGTTSITSPIITATGPVGLYSRTQAQIEAIVPGAAGKVYYCSDCTVTTVCVSTSATTLSWVSVGALATACD